MNETNNSTDDTPSERSSSFGRREYLKLAGTAGVLSAGSSAFVGQASAADDQPKRTLTIEATGPTANYNFSVSESVTHSEAMGATVGGDDIYGNEVVGHVAGSGRDSFAFTGELTAYSVDNDVLLYLNGEPLADTITVEDDPEGRTTNYEMRVDGEVLKSTAMSASIDDNDEITPRDNPGEIEKNQLSAEPLAGETYVLGGVNGGTDSYVISGDPTGFVADGRVNVYLNGEQISPAEFVRTTFTFESSNSDNASYEFSTSGDVTKSKYMGASINDNDDIGSGSANGAISGSGRDSYAFTGEVTDFSGSDNLRVYLNREEVDVATLSAEPQFQNTLTIEGNGGKTSYDFAVEGDLRENYGLGGADSISGKTAEGAVTSGQDSYTFSGDIASFNIETDGSFKTYLNGSEVEPETLGETQTTPDADQLPNEMSVRALTNARTEYGIGVSGTLATGDRANTWSGDNASYEYARGWVSGEGLDNYKNSGALTTLTDFDSIQIDVDREEEEIVISNTGDYEQTGYEILVSGDLEAYDASPSNIDGGRATGTVDQGTDVYGYTGDVFELTIQDAIRVEADYKPRTNHITVSNRDDVEHTFQVKAVDTSGSSEETLMEEDITVASNERTTYQTVFPVGKPSRLDVELEDGQSVSGDASVVGDFPLIYGLEAAVVPEGVGILPRHVDLGPGVEAIL